MYSCFICYEDLDDPAVVVRDILRVDLPEEDRARYEYADDEYAQRAFCEGHSDHYMAKSFEGNGDERAKALQGDQ